MKKTKKILSIVLAATVTVSSATPVLAESDTMDVVQASESLPSEEQNPDGASGGTDAAVPEQPGVDDAGMDDDTGETSSESVVTDDGGDDINAVEPDENPGERAELPALNAEEPEGDYEEDTILIAYEDALPDLDAVSGSAEKLQEIGAGAENSGIPAEDVLADAVTGSGADSSAELALSAVADGSSEIGTGDEQPQDEEILAAAAEEALEPLDETEETLAVLGITEQEVISDEGLGTEGYSLAAAELPEDVSVGEAIAVLNETPGIAYAEPNYELELADVDGYSVNDPSYTSQYYLDAANFQEAWKLLDQEYDGIENLEHSVTVAVLDSGCRYTHQDLADNLDLEMAYDAADQCRLTELSSSDAETSGKDGHGTHVCGLLSAVTDNNTGIAGASCNTVKILPVRIFNSAGKATVRDVVRALDYIADADSLRVVNMSITLYSNSTAFHQAIQKLYTEKDVLCVCAGGNGDERTTPYTIPCYPSDWEECMGVTSLYEDGNGVLRDAAYSDYNAAKDISAAGTNDYSTTWYSDSSYGYMSGTSMAAPLVSAAAALLWSCDPALSSAEVRELLSSTAEDVVHDDAREGNTGSAGALDIGAAMEKLIGTMHEDDPENLSIQKADILFCVNGDFSDSVSMTYTGEALVPDIRVTYDGVLLAEGTDYTVSLQDNTDAGTASVSIQGIGDYTGTVRKPFTITPERLTASDVTLSAEKLYYNAEVQHPGVTVKVLLDGSQNILSDGSTEGNENVALSYSTGCKKAGTYSVTVTGKGNYTGSVTKRFRITGNTPALNRKLFGKISGSTMKLTWGKVALADGYDIYLAQCGKSASVVKTIQDASVTSAQIKGMNNSQTYVSKIRAWRKVNGKKISVGTSMAIHTAGKNYKRTNPAKISVKKSEISLKAGQTSKISASITKENTARKLLGHTASYRYFSMDDSIASVSSSGVITAKNKGTAYIYVIGENGRKAGIKVTVT